ncbi:MAG: hypothetical protein KME26_26250 [Oscillatoria princeps RMCB-10]|nr:hypothetical protein [Oscillatoria princeps RMCB-10]
MGLRCRIRGCLTVGAIRAICETAPLAAACVGGVPGAGELWALIVPPAGQGSGSGLSTSA